MGSFSEDFEYKRCCFFHPHALLLHWRQCALSRSHLQVLLPYFILWQIWKAYNASRFDSQSFFVDAVIYQVVLDLRIASFVFHFKLSQLRGVFEFSDCGGFECYSST